MLLGSRSSTSVGALSRRTRTAQTRPPSLHSTSTTTSAACGNCFYSRSDRGSGAVVEVGRVRPRRHRPTRRGRPPSAHRRTSALYSPSSNSPRVLRKKKDREKPCRPTVQTTLRAPRQCSQKQSCRLLWSFPYLFS